MLLQHELRLGVGLPTPRPAIALPASAIPPTANHGRTPHWYIRRRPGLLPHKWIFTAQQHGHNGPPGDRRHHQCALKCRGANP